MNRHADILIIGDGQIGTALAKRLTADGISHVVTTRHRERVSAHKWHLDLASPEAARWEPPGRIKAVFFGAGQTRQSVCSADPAGTHAINVEATSQLVRRLSDAGAYVVFPSTNLVFDGHQPYRQEGDSLSPANEYGRQKAAAETRILAIAASAAILRLTKVISVETPLIANWTRALRAGERISAFADMVLAPIDQDTVVTAVLGLFRQRANGVFHLSGKDDLSYFEFARTLAATIASPLDQVMSGSWRSNPTVTEPPPAHTVLSATAIEKLLGIKSPSADRVLAFALDGRKDI